VCGQFFNALSGHGRANCLLLITRIKAVNQLFCLRVSLVYCYC